ncbi:MAG: transglycosylase domain-containing protein, partial [Bacteroidales bacterium]
MKIIKQFWFSLFLFLASLFWFCLPTPLFCEYPADILFSADSTLLGARIAPDGQWRFPEIECIPEKTEKAILCFEDKRFYNHPGVDPLSLARALYSNIKEQKVVSGGSTITMQLIRLSRKNRPRTI